MDFEYGLKDGMWTPTGVDPNWQGPANEIYLSGTAVRPIR
jgi:hypothetical protein